MNFLKNRFARPVSLLLVAGLFLTLYLVPSTVSALSFGPFTAYGGTIKATEDVIGLSHLVFVINNKEDDEEVLVISGGTIAFGICNVGGSIMGFGVQAGSFIQNIFAGCISIPAD